MEIKNKSKIELLSPAGTYDCFVAAMSNGADAVYFAGSKFGARAFAGNFSDEEVINAINYAHLLNKRVYLTINTVIKEQELDELYDFILPFYRVGLDGVIVQDIGAIKYIGDHFPGLELHASTQMSITDISGINFLKQLGVVRVVTARELSLSEISRIIKETGIEVETFIHGAMCYCYSGKCLFSSMIGGRSGNRGRCAQPCRLLYNDTHALSMKDMMGLNLLPSLIDAGISSLKIEGRMKNPEYVACVTYMYRKYIDLYYKKPEDYSVDNEDLRMLLDGYTRSGNCNGYYNQYNGKNMITFDFSGYNGDKSESLYNKIDYSFPKLEVDCECQFLIGERAFIRLSYDSKESITYGEIVEKAANRPLDASSIKKQILKTGDSPFKIKSINIINDSDIFMPVSKINELRRESLNDLMFKILKDYENHDLNEKNVYSYYTNPKSVHNAIKPEMSIEVNNCEQFKVAIQYNCIKRIIIPSYLLFASNNVHNKTLNNIHEVKELCNLAINKSIELYIRLPYVMRNITNSYADLLNNAISSLKISGLIICNYEGLNLIKNIAYEVTFISDFHLYNLNSIAQKVLIDNGITNTVVPVELNKKELIRRGIKHEILNVYGRLPLMISSQCVRKNITKCNKTPGFFYINDRKNTSIPCYCNCTDCINIQYNTVPLLIERDNSIIKALEPSSLKLNFTDENVDQMKDIIEYYISDGDIPDIEYTKGHLNRGVE